MFEQVEQGFDYQDGSKTLAAIADANPAFAAKDKIPRTRRLKTEPQRTRLPIPWPLVAGLVVEFIRGKRQGAALAILLMFTAYLRPGEAMDLQKTDLVPPMPGTKHFSLRMHPAIRDQQSKVDLGYEQLLKDWKWALKTMGLPADHAVLYQLRHSGPSHDRCLNLRPLAEVKQRGRWAADHSMKRLLKFRRSSISCPRRYKHSA